MSDSIPTIKGANYRKVAAYLKQNGFNVKPSELLKLELNKAKRGSETPKEVSINDAFHKAYVFFNLLASNITRTELIDYAGTDVKMREKITKVLDELGCKGKTTGKHLSSNDLAKALQITQDADKLFAYLKDLGKVAKEIPPVPFPSYAGGSGAKSDEEFEDFSFGD